MIDPPPLEEDDDPLLSLAVPADAPAKHNDTLAADLRRIFHIATPVALSQLSEWSMQLLSLAFVGHIDDGVNMPGVSLAFSWSNATLLFAYGFLAAMDTLCAQSFGAGNLELVGLTLQRGLLAAVGGFMVVAVSWVYTEEAMVAMGQQPHDARVAGEYLLPAIPGVLPFLWFNATQRYLQAQEVVWPIVVVGLLTNVVHVGVTQALVSWAGLGFTGVPLGLSVSRALLVVGLWAVILWRGTHRPTWGGWSWRVFDRRAWGEFCSLGLSGGGLYMIEATGYEILTLQAGWLGDAPLAAQSVVSNVYVLLWLVLQAYGTAAAVLVGQSLGARQPRRARHYAHLTLLMTLLGSTVMALLMYKLRAYICTLFTHNAQVVDDAGPAFAIAAPVYVEDVLAACLSGILIGVGRPAVGAVLNVVGYYIIAAPAGYYFGFVQGRALPGLWMGLVAAISVIVTGMLAFLLKLDWAREADRAARRAEVEGEGARLLSGSPGSPSVGVGSSV